MIAIMMATPIRSAVSVQSICAFVMSLPMPHFSRLGPRRLCPVPQVRSMLACDQRDRRAPLGARKSPYMSLDGIERHKL